MTSPSKVRKARPRHFHRIRDLFRGHVPSRPVRFVRADVFGGAVFEMSDGRHLYWSHHALADSAFAEGMGFTPELLAQVPKPTQDPADWFQDE